MAAAPTSTANRFAYPSFIVVLPVFMPDCPAFSLDDDTLSAASAARNPPFDSLDGGGFAGRT
jgi:hypothetical protein